MFYRKNLPGWERAMRVILGGRHDRIRARRPCRAAWLSDCGGRRGRHPHRFLRILPDVRDGRP